MWEAVLSRTGTTTDSVCQHLPMDMSDGLACPSHRAAGLGVWEGSLPTTAAPVVKHKDPMQGGRLRVKQNMLWGREEMTMKG